MREVLKNRIILCLLAYDMFGVTGFGLVAPIIAIFIKDNLTGGTVFAAGLASSLYLVVKSAVQLPISHYIDTKPDRYREWFVIVSGVLIVAVPFLYLSATHVYVIYLAQIIYGLGNGLNYPAWIGLWSTHMDKGRESFEWSLYQTVVGIGTAVSGAIGAAAADFFGFRTAFIIAGILNFLGWAMLFFMVREARIKRQALSEQRG